MIRSIFIPFCTTPRVSLVAGVVTDLRGWYSAPGPRVIPDLTQHRLSDQKLSAPPTRGPRKIVYYNNVKCYENYTQSRITLRVYVCTGCYPSWRVESVSCNIIVILQLKPLHDILTDSSSRIILNFFYINQSKLTTFLRYTYNPNVEESKPRKIRAKWNVWLES